MYFYIWSTTARLILRILFSVFFLYLGAIGSQCYKLAMKLRLLHRGKVAVPETSGWLQSAAVLAPLWFTRRVPTVSWWVLMVFIAALSKTTDFATAAVRSVPLQSECDFGQGLVLANNGTNFTSVPWATQSLIVAGNAQIYSLSNGCQYGIYYKANMDTTFCANKHDVMGNWTCVPTGDRSYSSTWNAQRVALDLVQRGLLYGPLYKWTATTVGSQNVTQPQWNHMVAWSSSVSHGSGDVFGVTAAVTTTVEKVGQKSIHLMNCTMNAPNANEIASSIESMQTLTEWINMLQQYMYNGEDSSAVDDPEGWLVWLLNNMIMVSGGSDHLYTLPFSDHPYQGCVVDGTYIPSGLVAMFFLTVGFCVALSVMFAVLWLRLRLHKNRKLVEGLPVDIWTWMAHAVAEAESRNFVRPKDLRRWNLGSTLDNGVKIQSQGQVEQIQLLVGNEGK